MERQVSSNWSSDADSSAIGAATRTRNEKATTVLMRINSTETRNESALDPFDGAPLRFKKRGDGLLIYSAGPDGIDTGGVIDSKSPFHPGIDMGFSLWDVDQRRGAPTLPEPASPAPR